MSKSKSTQSAENSIVLPKETRELNSFLALVVNATMQTYPTIFTLTKINCNKKGCDGIISSKLLVTNDKIAWQCSKCENSGIIKTGLNGISE
jgi:hypothetical protein